MSCKKDSQNNIYDGLNLGSPYLQHQQSSGTANSPSKLNNGLIGFTGHSPSTTHQHCGGGHSPSHIHQHASISPPPSTHAFNLAAFRSPGFLNAHGFAFGANFGYSRDHSPPSAGGGGAGAGGGGGSGPFDALNPSLHPSQASPNANAFINSLPHHPHHHAHHLHHALGGLANHHHHNSNSSPPPPHHLHYTAAPATPSPSGADSPNRAPPFLIANDYYSPGSGGGGVNHNNNNNNNNNSVHHHKKSAADDLPAHPYRSSSSTGGHLDFSASSANDQASSRADSESPELQIRDTASTPSDPKSESAQQGFHSPSHRDTTDDGSRSPENLSKSMIDQQHNNNSTHPQHHHPHQMHHHQQQQQHHHMMHGGGAQGQSKMPLSFLGPPLAALHSMTEMKSSGQTSSSSQQSSPTGGASTHQTTTTGGGGGAANPHGIDTILSRPPPSAAVTSAGLSALSNGELGVLP